jgi:GNAT superfamily N-acetyltransferase
VKGNKDHRITHRSVPGGPMLIGHIGPHNYDQAVQRLASVTTDALQEIGHREHPNVDHYQSGGIGHQDNDESRSVVGFMPTGFMKRYREHAGDQHSGSRDTIDKIKGDIAEGKGIHNPITVHYSDEHKWGFIGEGNHRLQAADESGLRTVPVRVIRGGADVGARKKKLIGDHMDLEGKFDQQRGDRVEPYTPSDIHPHHFMHEAMGQAGPDYKNLSFKDMSGEDYGFGPDMHHHRILFARHPDDGYVGRVHYTPADKDSPLRIHNLSVNDEHKRRGVASQLMGELERIHKGVEIEHGVRTKDGTQWAKHFYGHEGPAMDDGGSISPNTRDHKQVTSMGQAGPDYDNLSFEHGTSWGKPTIFAHHPDHGAVGALRYVHMDEGEHFATDEPHLEVEHIHVAPEHQRRGVASQMMNHLDRLHPNTLINHGFRTDEGHAWADQHYDKGDRGSTGEHWTRGGRTVKLGMGQAGPDYDNLSFHHGEHPLYPADREFQTIFAHHPEHGDVGRLTYREMDHPAWTGMPEHAVHVTMMHVPDEHRRRGVASQLMNHLETKVHPDTPIDHGDRRPDGNEWAKSKYNDPQGGKEKFNGEYGGGKSSWTMNGRPWNVETKKYRRMPKNAGLNTHPMENIGEWSRHQQGKQRVYDVHGSTGSRQTLCAQHAHAHLSLETERNIVGLNTGLIDHDHPEVTHDIKNPHEGQCQTCASHLRQEGTQLDRLHRIENPQAGQDDRRPNLRSPFTNGKPVGQWDQRGEPREHQEFQPRLPQSMSARFTPTKRVFTHTCGLDHRLFDGTKLRPEVRRYILKTLGAFWLPLYGAGWDSWSKVYFAGSEASEWTSDMLEGNNDFDVLVGVDYDKFRKHQNEEPQSEGEWTNEEITAHFNEQFRSLNNPNTWITVNGVPYGPFDNTWYVNQDSYDIKDIKPYAAYNVSDDCWAVKPPHLPHWSLSDLPRAVQRVLRACDTLANDVLKLPEPERTQQGNALFEAWHSDRSRAFSDRGEGWYDIANLREKWLDQEGTWAELVNCAHRWKNGEGRALEGWSNTPKGYVAGAINQNMRDAQSELEFARKHKNTADRGEADPEYQDALDASKEDSHQEYDQAILQKWLAQRPNRKTSSKTDDVFGKKDLHHLFPVDEDGPAPSTVTPWPQAGRSRDFKDYDEGKVARSITHPHEFPVQDVDPRILKGTQPKILRAGVQHYLSGAAGTYGEQNGNDRRLGNDTPRIYHRLDDDSHILLSGYHRAAAALLKGEPLRAHVIEGGWGPHR